MGGHVYFFGERCSSIIGLFNITYRKLSFLACDQVMSRLLDLIGSLEIFKV
jgi:hypothetical protein